MNALFIGGTGTIVRPSHPECRVEDPEFDEWCDRVITALEKAKQEI